MDEIGRDASLLARSALDWLLVMARGGGTGLAWTGRPDDDELDPTLYSGAAGIVLALLEGYRHFGDDRYGEAAGLGARSIAAAAGEGRELSSLYFGLTGMALALRAVHRVLGDRGAGQPGHAGTANRLGDGNAGIVRELLRYARIRDGRDPDYAITWPGQPPAAPLTRPPETSP